MRKWTLLLTCSLVFLGRPCRADEEYEGARGAAKKVVELVRAKKDEDLKKLAAEPGADPWLVVDELMGGGEATAAVSFAEVVAGEEAESLRKYARRAKRDPSDLRSTFEAAIQRSDLKDWEGAASLLERIESVPDGVLRARWLLVRAEALGRVSRWRASAADFRVAFGIAVRIGWRSVAITCLKNEGRARVRDNDMISAGDAWRRLADLQREAGDAEGLIRTLSDLARIADRAGDMRQAVSLYSDAIRLAPASTSAPVAALLRVRRSQALLRLGELATSFEDLDLAQRLLHGSDDAKAAAEAFGALSNFYSRIGERLRARVAAEHALELIESEAGQSGLDPREARRRVTLARATLANCRLEEGKIEEAVTLLAEARAAFLELDDRLHAGRCAQAIGEARLREGRWVEARALSISSAAELLDAGDVEGRLLAQANLAAAEEGLAHNDAAERAGAEVLDEAARYGYAAIVLEQCGRVARMRLLRKDAVGAIEVCDRGMQTLSDLFGLLDDGERVGARAWFGELFDLGMRASTQLKDDATFFRFLESGRAAALVDALGNRDTLRQHRIDPALDTARLDAAAAIAAGRRHLAGAGGDLARIKAATGEIDSARRRYDDAIRAIQLKHRGAAHVMFPTPDRLADVASRLSDDEAIIEFTEAGADTFAFVVTKGGGRVVPLGSTDRVRVACESDSWSENAGGAKAIADAWAALDLSSDLIWKPVVNSLPEGVVRVHVSPSGAVARVPIHALRASRALKSVVYTPSATTSGVLQAEGPRSGSGVLAFGLSKYSSATLEESPRSGLWGQFRLSDLPKAESEAIEVGSDVATDEQATEAEFRRRVAKSKRWSAVHFACHGLVNLDNPGLSALALRPGVGDDGFLTASEVFQTDIPADLVSLSACKSAGGRVMPGEGIVGLVRAFLFAGSPRVLASIWNVDDDAGTLFVKAFYAAWKKGSPAGVALGQAVDLVKGTKGFSHPKYWAGWVIWGAP